ncbi:MAG: hypothetical protein GTO45_38650 [Candidatus Aminicenantes bacterium]|nr:hypothetical protein [Candidatus Aminicenantes bacterium]NIM84537.1 hypothetical protein [Candidatus Aminicenantes bacterium]NIN24065.1 hypothetical protein [Candidatus Aminicenantes bacterium]NIN47771.1 hypothetical protein [Candidatus Aminicenantes bacterium]NIN90709.1 hypothetical protein [Candidatus Aminicenantes bacterium]
MNDSNESKNWERIVVDEIFKESVPFARLLRSKRKEGAPEYDMGIDNWDDETEDFIETWRVEAFVGYPPHMHLSEGDVFFVRNGYRLTQEYEREEDEAESKTHLLMHWDESKKLAREEIKAEYAKLFVASIAVQDLKHHKQLVNMVEKKFDRLKHMKIIKLEKSKLGKKSHK